MNGSMVNGGWRVGILLALYLGACDQTDHPVGEEKEPIEEPGTGGTDANSSNAGGTSNTGGNDAGTSNTGGNGASGNETSSDGGGSSSATSAGNSDWGGLPIPESCLEIGSRLDSEFSCEVMVQCADEWVMSHCLLEHDYVEDRDFISCTCLGLGDDVFYRMDDYLTDDLRVSDACDTALALCFQWPELDAGPYECGSSMEGSEGDTCYAETDCEREGTIGDQAFTESHLRVVECSPTEPGFSCSCTWPTLRRFEGETMPKCTAARDWCAGVGVEVLDNGGCSTSFWPPAADEPEDTCTVDVSCEADVLVDGEPMKMFNDTWVACNPTSTSGIYECQCLEDPGTTEVTADDADSACLQAAEKCLPR